MGIKILYININFVIMEQFMKFFKKIFLEMKNWAIQGSKLLREIVREGESKGVF